MQVIEDTAAWACPDKLWHLPADITPRQIVAIDEDLLAWTRCGRWLLGWVDETSHVQYHGVAAVLVPTADRCQDCWP